MLATIPLTIKLQESSINSTSQERDSTSYAKEEPSTVVVFILSSSTVRTRPQVVLIVNWQWVNWRLARRGGGG